MSNISMFEKLKVSLFKAYSENHGKMLIHTGIIAWAMSSMAQIFAIMVNDKIPKEQKMFMIPQEAADAVINIASFYAVTRTITGLGNKLVKCGKLLPKNINEYFTASLSKRGKKICGLGKWSFDVEKNLPKYLTGEYNSFKNGAEVGAILLGTILSCNILTPTLRNIYASHRQKKNIEKMNNPKEMSKIQKKYEKYNPLHGKNIYTFTNGSGLKV